MYRFIAISFVTHFSIMAYAVLHGDKVPHHVKCAISSFVGRYRIPRLVLPDGEDPTQGSIDLAQLRELLSVPFSWPRTTNA
jgi:hypothetical protein